MTLQKTLHLASGIHSCLHCAWQNQQRTLRLTNELTPKQTCQSGLAFLSLRAPKTSCWMQHVQSSPVQTLRVARTQSVHHRIASPPKRSQRPIARPTT